MLETLDLDKSLGKEEYVKDLVRYQVALHALGYQVYVQKRPVIIVYEGSDAGGKGGNIKRVTEKLDPRGYTVHPVAAPQGEDKTHHYLWRFWRRLPERGQIAIFDRSWYDRVMVERIEGFCTAEEWKRACREINHFERQLVDFGTILFKFYIHISEEEQLGRFKDREHTAYKAWKLTDEDWRNRARWTEYVDAVNKMFLRTSTLTAPWTVVEGNCKWHARIKVLRTLVEGLSHELNYDPLAPAPAIEKGQKKSQRPKHARKKERLTAAEMPLPMVDRYDYGTVGGGGKRNDSDVIIFPDGSVEPWQREEEHRFGPDSAERLKAAAPEVVIIGSGTVGNLRVHPEIVQGFESAGTEV
ncbi:MAG TPA: MTH938/NDUFAF3 family protein, partial [Anaerolineae bacterium]|nr:MTH938/NDUFAF3 family protein [Anaerolineae bacterium]